jgi:hypothetical protein
MVRNLAGVLAGVCCRIKTLAPSLRQNETSLWTKICHRSWIGSLPGLVKRVMLLTLR